MSDTPKRRPGRPRKSAIDKPEQFSIRLPLVSKLMLEMLARHINGSLAQAAEFAIQRLAKEVQIYRDTSVEVLAKDGLSTIYSLMGRQGHNQLLVARPLGGTMSDAERAVAMPEALRSPAESYFYNVLMDLSINYRVYPLADRAEAKQLWEYCVLAQYTDVPEFEVTKMWLVDHPAPEPPPYVRTAPPSGPSIPKPEKKKR